MNNNIKFDDLYLDCLTTNITIEEIGQCIEITLPFMNHNNDHLQIYIEKINAEQYKISDMGNTFNELELSGYDINCFNQEKTIDVIMNKFGVTWINDVLLARANINDFAIKFHMLIQAIIIINNIVVINQK